MNVYFKETLQVTSGNDASGNFCAHDINSLHEVCYILPKFYGCILTGLTPSNVSSKTVCIPNSRILVERKSKTSKKISFFHNSFVSHQHEILGAECFFEHDNSEAVYSASSFFKTLFERLFGKL